MHGSLTDGKESQPFFPEYINDFRQRLRKVKDFVRNEPRLPFCLLAWRRKGQFDQKSKPVTFEKGDTVWLFQPLSKQALRHNYRDLAYDLMKKINDLVHEIQFRAKSKPKLLHLEILSPYHGRDPQYWNKVVQDEQLEEAK